MKGTPKPKWNSIMQIFLLRKNTALKINETCLTYQAIFQFPDTESWIPKARKSNRCCVCIFLKENMPSGSQGSKIISSQWNKNWLSTGSGVWWGNHMASVHLSSSGATENLKALPTTWSGLGVTLKVPGSWDELSATAEGQSPNHSLGMRPKSSLQQQQMLG